jgi:hypothetical protein
MATITALEDQAELKTPNEMRGPMTISSWNDLDPKVRAWIESRLEEIPNILKLLTPTAARDLAGTCIDNDYTPHLFHKRPELDPEEIAAAYRHAREPPSSAKEVREMFSKLKPHKTGGGYNTSREHWIHAPDDILTGLIPVIKSILAGKTFASMKIGIIVCLTKDTKRYRPVTLLQDIWKATTARVTDRILDMYAKYGILNSSQQAFIRLGSTAGPLTVINTIIQDTRQLSPE